MTWEQQLNEALAAVREVRLDKKSDAELVVILKVFHKWRVSEHAPQAPISIKAVEDEMARRRELAAAQATAQAEEARHQEALALNRQAIAESKQANRLSVRAIVIALAALVVAALGVYWQWRQMHAR
jgi:hypothetical protein